MDDGGEAVRSLCGGGRGRVVAAGDPVTGGGGGGGGLGVSGRALEEEEEGEEKEKGRAVGGRQAARQAGDHFTRCPM